MAAVSLVVALAGCDPRVPARSEPAAPPSSQPAPPAAWPDPDAGVDWRRWGPEAFREARKQGRPLLLYLSGPGCDGLFAGPDELGRWLARTRFIPVRADPERRPEVARRYAPAGCPSLSLLLATGEEAVRATDIRPANVATLLSRLHEHLQKRPAVVAEKVRSSRRRLPDHALDADAVYAAFAAGFDTVAGGFGGPYKFVAPQALAFLQDYAVRRHAETAGDMVERTLEAILASPMWDAAGVMAYSHTPDWGTPRQEMAVSDQAGLLAVLGRSRSAPLRRAGGDLFDAVATRWFDGGRGVFAGRRLGRARGTTWWTDPVPCSDDNALMIRALLLSGPLLNRSDAARRLAETAGRFLLTRLVDDDGRVRHADAGGSSAGLLRDQMLVGLAFGDLARAGGDPRFAEAAGRVLSWADDHLWDEDRGAYADAPAPGYVSAWRARYEYADDRRPAGQALAAEALLAAGDTVRARRVLSGLRLSQRPGRMHASAARVLLALEAAEIQTP